ncbi:MAG: glycosyltransferase [Planctomycetes bacterium]|nr:glycosyltransferase [Planctomycetota bacterium]
MNADLPAVTVVFATMNHAPTIGALLDALDATDWPDLEVVAVDCGSTDGTAEALQRRAASPRAPRLQLLRAPRAGRASALNLAFAQAGARDVVRLHGDVVPDAPDWLRRLHDVFALRRDCGIVGAKIVLAGGRIQTCGRDLINGLGIVPEWSDQRWMEADRDDPPAAREVDGVGGELCWIRRAVLDRVGLLDTNFDPVFGDDDDLCLRARHAGFAVMVEPAVRGVHYAPRHTRFTHPILGGCQPLREQREQRELLVTAHRDYFRRKWGFDPSAPDLHEVRRRYGHTRICWRIGDGLTEQLPSQPAVDVCLVTWNSMAILPRFLDQLAQTRWPDVKVWIADNGSRDDTVRYLRERAVGFPFAIHVEALPQNIGVAQALNAVIVQGTAPIVARLDDDAFVPPEWLERLVPRFHQRPFAGMVGPRIAHDNPDATLQNGPLRMWPEPLAGIGPRDGARVEGLARVVTIRGCCNVYRRSVFDRVGLLDVRFSPSQFDEWDHHIACAVAGYEALYDGGVVVRHQLNAGRMATPAAYGNFEGNQLKSDARWGGDHWAALDRAIDVSIDGRLLPPDGDTSALRRRLPPIDAGAPQPVPRSPQELAALREVAVARSLGRGLDTAAALWLRHQTDVCEHATAQGHGQNQGLVMALMDLAPHFPRALMEVALFRNLDGDVQSAARTARWALRLAPQDQALQQKARALAHGTIALPRPPAPATPAQVVLLPPMQHDDTCERMLRQVAAALDAVGVDHRVDRRLQPVLDGAEVVHVIGLREPTTLLPRLQYVRATAPHCRIVMTPLAGDAAAADRVGRDVGAFYFREPTVVEEGYRRLCAAPLRADTAPPNPEVAWRAELERRCVAFVDELLSHVPGDCDGLARSHAHRTSRALDEGLEVSPVRDDCAPTAPTTPFGGVLLLGPRDLPGNHHAVAMALRGCDVPLTMIGHMAHPFGDWYLQAALGDVLTLAPPASGPADELAALRRSAVLVWTPCEARSFAVPLLAAIAGCELVLARGLDAEQVFGEHATYVDPHDLPALRTAVLAARVRWRDDPTQPWRQRLAARFAPSTFGSALQAAYRGRGSATKAVPGTVAVPI